jgi:hypothetical protein
MTTADLCTLCAVGDHRRHDFNGRGSCLESPGDYPGQWCMCEWRLK